MRFMCRPRAYILNLYSIPRLKKVHFYNVLKVLYFHALFFAAVNLTSFTIVITEYSKDATIMHRMAQRLCANLQYGE